MIQDYFLTQIQQLEQCTSHLSTTPSTTQHPQHPAQHPGKQNRDKNLSFSYQQYNQLEIMGVYGRYFANLREAYLRVKGSGAGRERYRVCEKLLGEYSLLGNSLWAYCDSITDYLHTLTLTTKSNPNHPQHIYLQLSHLHHQSQSPLLALYLNIMQSTRTSTSTSTRTQSQKNSSKISITGSKKNVSRGWANCTVKFSEVDKVSAFRSLMEREGVRVGYFEDREQEMEEKEEKKEKEEVEKQEKIEEKEIEVSKLAEWDIQIIDLFDTHITVYKPYLLTHYSHQPTQSPTPKIHIFYTHPTQAPTLTTFLTNLLTPASTSPTLHHLQINSTFPHETSTIYTNSTNHKFEEELLIFLNEESNHANKQDVVIFHEPTEEFVRGLRNYVKKCNGELLGNLRFVSKDNAEVKESLPPPPPFLSKVYQSGISKASSISQSPQKTPKQPQIPTDSPHPKSIPTEPPKPAPTPPTHTHPHNNIIIVPNFKSLTELNIDLSHVFYVFDYRSDETFHYDYQLMSYVEGTQEFVTAGELGLRVGCVGLYKIGKYCYVVEGDGERDGERVRGGNGGELELVTDKKTMDIGYYCLQMIEGGFQSFWEDIQKCKQIKNCISALQQAQIIKKQLLQGSKYPHYKLTKKQLLKPLSKMQNLNPILASVILKAKNGDQQHQIAPSKLALQLAIATSIMMTPGNLRQSSTSPTVSNRPTQIWRLSGYLHSCMQILIRAKIIQSRQHMTGPSRSKRTLSNRLSQVNSQEFDVFGNLFEIVIADRITFDQMKLEDLLREEFVNQVVFNRVVDAGERICQVLDLEDFVFTSFEDINPVIIDIVKGSTKAIGVYSGSRRIGYFLENQPNGIFPSKPCLLTTLNQRPAFIHISRLASTEQLSGNTKLQIQMCNSIPQLVLFQSIGMNSVPSRKTNSYGESVIEYHAVSSLVFKSLWRNEGIDVQNFEDRFGCLVEPNQEIAIITIHCPKEKEAQIKDQFNILLNRIKEKMTAQTKISPYLGTTSLLLGVGGSIIQVVKDKYINKCIVSNLDLSVQIQDLQQLFQQFFILKDIKLMRQPPSAPFKSAYIEFQTQKDYYKFHEYYNECLYLNRFIRVAPVESAPTVSTYKEQMYLQFTWNVWKSMGEAMVEFQEQEPALKCLQSLRTTKLDQRMVKAEIRKGNAVYMTGLNALTDQITLQSVLENYGKIKFIQILKTPSKQMLKSVQNYLLQQIKKAIIPQNQMNNNNLYLKPQKFERLKNGLRKCKVTYRDQAKLNQTIAKLNKKTSVMGLGRLHITSWFVYPIKVAHGYTTLYEQLINYVLGKLPQNRIKLEHTIYNEHEYIVAKSHLKQEIDLFKAEVNKELQGYGADLTGLDSNILLTEVGMRNLMDLEEKYNCRLIPDFGKKILLIQTLFDNLKSIKQQIKAKVNDKFFYRISLNQKSYKHMKQNPELLTNMKNQYFLAKLQLQQVGRNLLLQGSANHVEKAFNYLMHLIQSVSKPTEEEMFNSDVCGVCCEEPFRPYRLQRCGHKFCLGCILDFVNTCIGDLSMFPVKCPQCLAQLAVMDMGQLLTPQMWIKSNNMALNQYVGRNSQIISNCYTAGCKQVNFLIKDHFNCDQCQQTYCTGCKLNYHPGLTCQQAKMGGNAAFEKYMKENGIRKCPNATCKMPIMRTDGCYRVTCSRCNKSMCFKCEPEKMIAYDHYNDCYKHLTDVHGGYW